MIIRLSHEPILGPGSISPSHPDLRVLGVFNPGAVRFGDEILLLVRVAEEAVQESSSGIRIPLLEHAGAGATWSPSVVHLADDGNLDVTDPREVRYNGRSFLSSISHLRLARSHDGVTFTIDPEPTILPRGPWETYGIETPRITFVDGRHLIQYTAVSEHGVAVGLMETIDWQSFRRLGLIFLRQTRTYASSRGASMAGSSRFTVRKPAPLRPSIWLAYSPDLLHWGDHRPLISPREGMWDASRIGGGAPPIETEAGWLEIYHGVGQDGAYHLGALLLDRDDPSRILARSDEPLLSPEQDYEKAGFYSNTVFSNGIVIHPTNPDLLLVYYGAADRSVGVCQMSVSHLLGTLRRRGI